MEDFIEPEDDDREIGDTSKIDRVLWIIGTLIAAGLTAVALYLAFPHHASTYDATSESPHPHACCSGLSKRGG